MTPEEREEALESLFGEGMHTGWRKGTDADQSTEIWKLIAQMDPEEWTGYIRWVIWGLRESGVTVELADDGSESRD